MCVFFSFVGGCYRTLPKRSKTHDGAREAPIHRALCWSRQGWLPRISWVSLVSYEKQRLVVFLKFLGIPQSRCFRVTSYLFMCWFAKWLGFWSTISETSRVTAVATDSNSMIPVQSLSAIHSIAYIMNMFHCPHQFVWDDSSGPPISMYFSVESCCEIINFKGFFATRSNQTRIGTWGFIKKNRPFNHIFGGDRILRAWYRGINNAGPRKGAQGRAQDIPYQSISPYHHGI